MFRELLCVVQIKEEMAGCLDFLKHVYGIFGFSFNMKLATRPDKYLGRLEMWDMAEKVGHHTVIFAHFINISFAFMPDYFPV